MTARKYWVAIIPALVFLTAAGWYFFRQMRPASIHTTRILCMGDSITTSHYGDYTRHLAARFRQRDPSIQVNAAARPGNTSGEYLHWLRGSDILDKVNPDIVIVMLGTNDTRRDSDHTPTRRFSLQMSAILDILSAHRNPDTSRPMILLSTIPPIPRPDLPLFDATSQKRVENEINPAIRELARKKGLPLVDTHEFFKRNPGLMSGVHPSPAGYNALGLYLFRYLNEIMSRSSAGDQERLPEGLTGTIAFESDRRGNFDIFLLNRAGIRQLTHASSHDGHPAFSPTGESLVFESDRGGRFEIHLADSAGSIRRLFPSPSQDRAPYWTRDGQYVYFARLVNGREQIFRYRFQGEVVERVTHSRQRTGVPCVSPDGKTLMVTAHRLLGWNLYRIELSTLSETLFSRGYAGCRSRYSHSGQWVAFVSHKFDQRGDIILSPADHFAPQRLTRDGDRYDYYPAFSPDDRYLVYASGPQLKGGNYDLRIMEIRSRRIWTITHHPATDIKPFWGPR